MDQFGLTEYGPQATHDKPVRIHRNPLYSTAPARLPSARAPVPPAATSVHAKSSVQLVHDHTSSHELQLQIEELQQTLAVLQGKLLAAERQAQEHEDLIRQQASALQEERHKHREQENIIQLQAAKLRKYVRIVQSQELTTVRQQGYDEGYKRGFGDAQQQNAHASAPPTPAVQTTSQTAETASRNDVSPQGRQVPPKPRHPGYEDIEQEIAEHEKRIQELRQTHPEDPEPRVPPFGQNLTLGVSPH